MHIYGDLRRLPSATPSLVTGDSVNFVNKGKILSFRSKTRFVPKWSTSYLPYHGVISVALSVLV